LYQIISPIVDRKIVSDQIHLLTFKSKEIAKDAKPGQFVNVRVSNGLYPYLRRPFSICEVNYDTFSILFSVFGMGTKVLAEKKAGGSLDVIGPLGKGFSIDKDFESAIIVAGGLGSAPFPFLISRLKPDVNIKSFVGARTKELLISYKLENISFATDDGSYGKKMNVVELLSDEFQKGSFDSKVKLYGCGPTLMLKALSKFALENNFDCEISTEAAMACGFGICQGCPMESSNGEKYFLVCKDGPVFNVRDVKL